MADDLVQRAKAALEGVTEGPWEADHCDPSVWSPKVIVIGQYTARDDFDSTMWDDGKREDREFIAAARTLVPELVERIEDVESWLFLIQEARVDYDAAMSRREHGGVALARFRDSVFYALNGIEARQ